MKNKIEEPRISSTRKVRWGQYFLFIQLIWRVKQRKLWINIIKKKVFQSQIRFLSNTKKSEMSKYFCIHFFCHISQCRHFLSCLHFAHFSRIWLKIKGISLHELCRGSKVFILYFTNNLFTGKTTHLCINFIL